MKVCPSCNLIYMPNASFCADDGIRLIDLRCGYCGADVGPKAAYCPICGQHIVNQIQERLRKYDDAKAITSESTVPE